MSNSSVHDGERTVQTMTQEIRDTQPDRESSTTRFDGPDYLTGFEADPAAINRLQEIQSATAHRLLKRQRDEWPGMESSEDYLAPLTAAEGDILYRVINTPGNDWVWWRGNALGKHHYGRVSALPHYQDHKIVNRRKATPDKLGEVLKNGRVIPVHVSNAPESIISCIESDSPYRNRFSTGSDMHGDQ